MEHYLKELKAEGVVQAVTNKSVEIEVTLAPQRWTQRLLLVR